MGCAKLGMGLENVLDSVSMTQVLLKHRIQESCGRVTLAA